MLYVSPWVTRIQIYHYDLNYNYMLSPSHLDTPEKMLLLLFYHNIKCLC